MKWMVEGIESVRDVVEADTKEEAQRVFVTRYPAIYAITATETLEDFKRRQKDGPKQN
jgi:hypothetical protein